jgi:hypothetical protein
MSMHWDRARTMARQAREFSDSLSSRAAPKREPSKAELQAMLADAAANTARVTNDFETTDQGANP